MANITALMMAMAMAMTMTMVILVVMLGAMVMATVKRMMMMVMVPMRAGARDRQKTPGCIMSNICTNLTMIQRVMVIRVTAVSPITIGVTDP